VATSQSLIVRSQDPEARTFPSGEKATEWTIPVCPRRVRSSFPVATSQSLIVWSSDPEARIFPSGEKATEQDVRPYARRGCGCAPGSRRPRFGWNYRHQSRF
jgi:hypothetical protein